MVIMARDKGFTVLDTVKLICPAKQVLVQSYKYRKAGSIFA